MQSGPATRELDVRTEVRATTTRHDASWLAFEANKAGACEVFSKADVETLLSVMESITFLEINAAKHRSRAG
jgi:hypothetical protein